MACGSNRNKAEFEEAVRTSNASRQDLKATFSFPQLQAKEREVIGAAARQMPSPSKELVVYYLLTQRHLRQTILILEGGLRFQKAESDDASHIEDLVLDVRPLTR